MARKRYGVQIGSSNQYLYFYASSASYDGLESTLGLKDVDAESFDGTVDRINTRSKLRSRVAVRYELTSTTSRVVRLWCATAKINDALNNLPSKQYKTKNIIDAYIPVRYGVG